MQILDEWFCFILLKFLKPKQTIKILVFFIVSNSLSMNTFIKVMNFEILRRFLYLYIFEDIKIHFIDSLIFCL